MTNAVKLEWNETSPRSHYGNAGKFDCKLMKSLDAVVLFYGGGKLIKECKKWRTGCNWMSLLCSGA